MTYSARANWTVAAAGSLVGVIAGLIGAAFSIAECATSFSVSYLLAAAVALCIAGFSLSGLRSAIRAYPISIRIDADSVVIATLMTSHRIRLSDLRMENPQFKKAAVRREFVLYSQAPRTGRFLVTGNMFGAHFDGLRKSIELATASSSEGQVTMDH
jgi:hypothetical protein